MLITSQKNLLASLHSEKDLKALGLCLVEGEKNIKTAGSTIEFTFTAKDTKKFKKLVTTKTPQKKVGIAKIPNYTNKDIEKFSLIIVLDGVQDPGNVGTIFRLCLGFNASLLLVNCAHPASTKVIRASVGAMFSVPWQEITADVVQQKIKALKRPVYRLEKAKKSVKKLPQKKVVLIVGSEGSGITLPIQGISLSISHSKKLESLNIGHALAITMSNFYKSSFGIPTYTSNAKQGLSIR